MKNFTAILLMLFLTFGTTLAWSDFKYEGEVGDIPETSYPTGEDSYLEENDYAEWQTGGGGFFEAGAEGPETEAWGTIGLYDSDGNFEISGDEFSSSIEAWGTQSVGGNANAFGEEVWGSLEGVAQQMSNFQTLREVEWESGAETGAFAVGGQYGEAGFSLETEGTGSIEISGEGTIYGESVGWTNNIQLSEEGIYGYRSEAFSSVENTGEASFVMDGDGTGSAYVSGEGVAKSGTYAGHEFEDGVQAFAATDGEAEFGYTVEASCSGEECVGGSVTGEGSATTEGYSQVWQEDGGTYAHSWQQSVSSTESPTSAFAEGAVGGLTGSGSSED